MSESTNTRIVAIANSKANHALEYPNNSVSTSKYTIVSFFPKNLFEQFRKAANVYFAIISVLSALPTSPKDFFSLVGTFTLVLLFTAVKEAVEDIQRHKQDKKDNGMLTRRLGVKGKTLGRILADIDEVAMRGSGNTFTLSETRHLEQIAFQDIQVGDLVVVYSDELIPADLVLLATGNTDSGICFVDTSNLDGESNLKVKYSVSATNSVATWQSFCTKANGGTILCEQPSRELYHFHGVMELEDNTVHELDINHLLIRGSRLRNTSWAIGVAVNTGHETKLMLNAMVVPSKISTFEIQLNRCLYAIFALQGLVCTANTAFAFQYLETGWINNPTLSNQKYEGNLLQSQLFPNAESLTSFLFATESFFTFMVTYSNIIPISLYVAMEIVKIAQKYLIDRDIEMYHEETDTGASSRTSNLIADLGQVEYLFTDKTGTLTCNEMVFHSCAIKSFMYKVGTQTPKLRPEGSRRRIETLEEINQNICISSCESDSISRCNNKACMCYNLKIELQSTSLETQSPIHRFWKLLALCHSCIPCHSEQMGDKIQYEGESPDDVALVDASRRFGYRFVKRQCGRLYTQVADGNGCFHDESYEELLHIDFSSDRKRMSVVIKESNGTIRLLAKGADEVMLPRIRMSKDGFDKSDLETCTSQLKMFSKLGLRTLCLCEKEIADAEWKQWQSEFQEAKYRGDELKQFILVDNLERGLTYVGITAIEDQLQRGVPDAIRDLRKAKIRVWMLTGDKEETAINIGYASELIDAEHSLVISLTALLEERFPPPPIRTLTNKTPSRKSIKHQKIPSEELVKLLQGVKEQLIECESKGLSTAIVITGATLQVLLRETCRSILLDILTMSDTCICCRVSPIQKAEMVSLVRKGKNKVTMAVGDGGNDVPMIQAAHIGVGISGLEGMQAVRSSDYSIAQFRFLTKLLLVHGRWGYHRLSKFVLYYFYKNVVVSFAELVFAYYSMFSGQVFFADWFSLLYNAGYTSYPCIVAFTMEQDVSSDDCLKYPELYAYKRHKVFSLRRFLKWFGNGFVHGVLCYAIPTASIVVLGNGKNTGLWFYGTTCFNCVVIAVTLKMVLETKYWTMFFVAILILNIAAYVVSLVVFNSNVGGTMLQHELWSIPAILVSSTSFWYSTVLTTGCIAVWELFQIAVKKQLFGEVDPHDDLTIVARRRRNGKGRRKILPASPAK